MPVSPSGTSQHIDKKRLLEAVSHLGTGEYRDGSSANPGWLYQPMGDFVPELEGVSSHNGEACRFTLAEIEGSGKIPSGSTLIDVGCATGYYLMGFPRCEGLGYEADPAARAVCRALGLRVFEPGDQVTGVMRRPVTILMLNVHQWLVKQGCDAEWMDAASGAGQMFFQTAGKNSAGRYTVDWLDTKDDELWYLSQWWGQVCFLHENPHHGGIRRLWYCGAPRRRSR